MRRTRLGTCSIAAATLLSTACHSYTPVTSEGPTPGGVVRVRLTNKGAADIASAVGPGAQTLEGRVARMDDSLLVVQVTDLTRASGQDEAWKGEPVTVPRSDIAEIAVPKLSRGRTALLVAGFAAGVAALAGALGAGSAVGGRSSGPPGGAQ